MQRIRGFMKVRYTKLVSYFPVAVTNIWNILPIAITSASPLAVFKQRFDISLSLL